MRESIFTTKIFREIQLKETSKEFLQYISPLFVIGTVGVLIGFFQIWLLQKYGGSEESGFYGLAYQIAAMSFFFTSAMTQIITREFSKSFGEGDREKIRELFLKYVPMLYAIASFFSMFLLFQAESVLMVFTDERFLEATAVVMIMSFYPVHQTYGQISGSLFMATDRTKEYRNTGLISQSISLVISIFLVYIFDMGAVGFAITMVVAQLIGVNIQLYYNSRYLSMNFLALLSNQAYTVLFFILASYISSMAILEEAIYSFLLSGVVYTLISGVAYFIWRRFGK
jgi:O-antigen/teichoic acid export membrane protein